MLSRALPFVALAVALALFMGVPAVADEKAEKGDTHEGTVVSFTGTKLVMKDKSDKEHTHTLAPDAVLMIDDKKSDVAAFRDLKPGTKIRVTTKKGDKNTAIKVEALDRNKEFPKLTDN
jgi:hypothetical protein